MTSRRWVKLVAALGLGLALAGTRGAHGQFAGYPSLGQVGAGYPSFGQVGTNLGAGVGHGGIGFGGGAPTGYGIVSGRIGSVYQSAGSLYGQAYRVSRPQTTVALQPLYSAITSLPGWDGPTRRSPRRYHRRPIAPSIQTIDRDGKILRPSTIPPDPASDRLRQAAEAAVRAVVRESKSTGHASIRPVIDAKNRLSAYERKILPGIKGRNVTEGDDLERFFVELDRALDAMNSVF